ncbi:hypothetical protein [Micromonospora sp. NPDC126480]|uniref:hypothetical protein n=1 Tax=Micromonospora sp. NPDC126480 TaxID=3155312 RepID=UPI00333364EB
MLIDCDRCGVQGAGCSGCLVTALFDEGSPALGAAEARAVEVFARAGFDVEVLPEPSSVPTHGAPARARARRRRVA